MSHGERTTAGAFALLLLLSGSVPAEDPAPPRAGFFLDRWYRRGPEHGNPDFNTRLRVNAPEAVLHPEFSKRVEARGNGMMQILAEEDLLLLEGAELVLETWGGHPGTARKRVTVNGRSLYLLRENGTAEGHCTHLFPVIPLRRSDLVNGYNVFQFACDQGSSFWGHFIVDQAALRLYPARTHPLFRDPLLAAFAPKLTVERLSAEIVRLRLEGLDGLVDRVAAVEFHGFYDGYDENGDGVALDWHGFSKGREPVSIIGRLERPPFALDWAGDLLPAPQDAAVAAIVRFLEPVGLGYRTPAEPVKIPSRPGIRVKLHHPKTLPRPFWSRAGRKVECGIELDEDPAAIERAQLEVVIWDGGRGNVEAPFTLNGHPLEVAGEGRHDSIHRVIELDRALLLRGENRIELLSDTEHHGIEVLLPGPAIVVRSRS